MNSENGINGTMIAETRPKRFLRPTENNARMRRMTYSVLAGFGVLGGIASLFVGIVFVVLHSLVEGDRMFDRGGTVLLIVAIPMILIGSLFVDGIDGANN